MPNPALRLDPGLGLVVLQFRDDQGEVVATLPTERELAAYRDAGKRAASPPSLPAPGQQPGSGAATAASPTAAPTPAEARTPAVASPSASAVTTPPSPAPKLSPAVSPG
jgi:hypothetical protein